MPSVKDPIRMRESDPVLLFFQRVRDETHNTAIKYQRDVRSRNAIRSELESITGVGAAMRNRLLRHFGGVDAVREATAAQLREVSGVGLSWQKEYAIIFSAESSEEFVLWSFSTLWWDPLNDLVGVSDVTGLAVHTVGEINLQSFSKVRG